MERLKQGEQLGLDGNPIGDDGLALIAGLRKLKWLDLEDTGITGAGLEHLKGLHSLEVLKTRRMPDADAAAPRLACLTKLEELALPGAHDDRSLTDAGLAHLTPLARLKRLNVQWQRLTDAGLAHLADQAELEELDLSDNNEIDGPGLEHLRRLPKLRRLKLDSTGVSNATVPLLKEFTGLEELGLFGTKIGERGLAKLRKELPNARLCAGSHRP